MATFLTQLLRLNNIKGNIIKALFAMGILTLMLGIFAFIQTRRIQQEKFRLEAYMQPAMTASLEIRSGLGDTYKWLNQYATSGNELYRKRYEESWTEEIDPALALLDTLHAKKAVQLQANSLQALGSEREGLRERGTDLIKQVQHQKQAGVYGESSDKEISRPIPAHLQLVLSGKISPQLDAMQGEARKIEINLHNQIEAQQALIDRYIRTLQWSGLAGLALSFMLGIPIAYFLIAQLYRSLYQIKSTLKQFRLGNLPEQIHQSKNETHHITDELNLLSQELHQLRSLALQVGAGQFDHEITVFNNQGNLGESLARMKNSLSEVAKADRQRNWVNEGFARFGDILRSNNESIARLTDAALHYLVKYVKVNQGALFLVEGEGEGAHLNLAACYAYDRKKYLNIEILKGEGLCGQAWQENDLLLITDIPDDYIKIKSGLGTSNPTAILVLPLSSNEETVGVLELASFENFKEYEIEFIRRAGENLAAAINNARTNERTLHLLEESQQLTEAMRAQEEEMRQNMEELESTQEEMERAQEEIRKKEQNLNSVINNTSDTIFAIDRDYRITVVNQVLKNKYKGMGIDLKEGTLISEILPASAWEKWKLRYDRALAGEQYSMIEETKSPSGSVFNQTFHNPIRNEAGQIIGVSVISRNVTDMLLNEQKAEQKQATLSSLIDNTSDTFFAIDTNYRILVANKTLKDRFAASGTELQEGDLIFDKLAKDQIQFWKEKYDRALAGESFSFMQDRKVGSETLYIEVSCNPIVDTEGKVSGASVVSKDQTRWKQAMQELETRENEMAKIRASVGFGASSRPRKTSV